MSTDEAPVSRGAKAASLLLALLPPSRMAWIVFTNGENNLSNDYVHRAPLVGSMLDGTCSVGKFVREAWIGGAHSGLAIFPIYYLNARLFHWSVWVELGLGLVLAAATVALLAGALPRRTRWLLLPLLSLLIFSTSRVTVFTFGEAALQQGLSQLGVVFGAFAFVQWRERPLALATALASGGILASWSWGGGLVTWPVFAVALLFLHVHSPGAWAIFLSGALAGIAQYVFFSAPGSPAMMLMPGPRIPPFLDLLGRPFVNGISQATPIPESQAAGTGGLLALVAMPVFLRAKLRARPAPFLLVAWTLLVALQIALLRSGIAPWYASPMALFWAGLLMLVADAPAPVRTGGILVVALLTLRVQRSWEDKSFYLPSRAPVSASCLREWRAAPEACHARVFQWPREGREGELASLGEVLERHRLSVFGPRRTYLLQGDVAVGRVAVETPSVPAFFSRDDRTPADPNGFHRLDLVLTPGASVAWRVDLPPGTRRATYSTVIRASQGDAQSGRSARISVTAEGSSVLLDNRTFLPDEAARRPSLDLSSLAGKRITLRLAAEETHEGASPLILEAPRLELVLERAK